MTGISSLGQALNQIERVKEQQSLLDILGRQMTTGKKTTVFSGLGSDALTSQRSRANFKALDTYITNIKNADRRINLMTNAIDEFKKQAENFVNYLVNFTEQSPHQQGEVVYYDDPGTSAVENVAVGTTSADPDVDLQNIKDFAGNVYDLFVDMLNVRDGERYLLSGAETRTAPIVDSGMLDSALSNLFSEWRAENITTDEFIADLQDRTTSSGNTDAITDTIVGYSSALSAGTTRNVFVRVEEDAEVNYTALANEEPFRNILVAVAYLKNENLGPIADEVDPNTLAVITDGAPGANMEEQVDNFFSVFESLVAMVNQAIDDIDQVRFRLENARATITETRYSHEAQQALLLDTVTDIEDADINAVAVRMQTLSTQIEASYRVTVLTQNLSLVNIL